MSRQGQEKILGIILMMAVLMVFLQVAGHDFIIFDDGAYIINNDHVKSGPTLENIRWAFTSMEASNWHPLTWLSHMLDCHLYGLNPAGHHLTSLFFHVANTLLLFLLLRETTHRLWASAMVAALFGLHPLHVESVAWVSERKDVLSAFFWMVTMLAYVRYSRRPGHGRYVLILISFTLGLMAKPMLVTLPFVLLLLDFWPLSRMKLPDSQGRGIIPLSIGRLVWEKVPLFLLSAASSVVTYIVQSESGAVTTFQVISLKVRILNAFLSYVRYLEKLFLPHDLAIFYPHPGQSLPAWQGIAAALPIILITLFVLWKRDRHSFLLTGWLWYLGTLVPVIGIVQVGGQSTADRYTYIPSIGLFIMAVWGISRLTKKLPYRKGFLGVGALIILSFLSMVAWSHLGYWRNSEKLFRHAIAVTRRNYVAHGNLGTVLLEKDRLNEALTEFKKALDIWPRYPDAHNNLGVVLARQGLIEEAIRHYEEAIQSSPRHLLAHLNMANALVELGRPFEAVPYYSKALGLDPNAGAVHSAFGVALAQLNRVDEAVLHMNRAIELCPKCPEPFNNLGRVLTRKGDLDEAIKRLRQAIELQPQYAEAHNNFGLALLQVGELEEAVYHFASALHYKPGYPKARSNLRMAFDRLSRQLEEEGIFQ